ncbi:MAG: hypothetical protein AAB668_03650 [Patescibacteria group bacterium]
MAAPKKQAAVPSELGNITQDTVERLEEKLGKCYSEDRHAVFQAEVRKIVIEVLGHDDGREKIKPCAKESAKEYSDEKAKEKKGFLTPNIINGIMALGVVGSLVVSVIALLRTQ